MAAPVIAVLAVVLVVAVVVWRKDAERPTSRARGAGDVVDAPDLPLLGPSDATSTWTVTRYSPGRGYDAVVRPAGSTAPYTYGADARPGGALTAVLGSAPRSWSHVEVAGQPGVAGWIAPGQAALYWQATPDAVARVVLDDAFEPAQPGSGTSPTSSDPTTEPLPAAQVDDLVAVAESLVGQDESAWTAAIGTSEVLLGSGTTQPPTPLPQVGLDDEGDVTELASVTATSISEVLAVEGFPAASFALVYGTDTVDLDLFELDGITVGGQPAAWTDGTTGPTGVAFSHQVIWAADGVTYQLFTTDDIDEDQAVAVANRVTALDDAQWQALLFPSQLHTDLVPLPGIVDLSVVETSSGTMPLTDLQPGG